MTYLALIDDNTSSYFFNLKEIFLLICLSAIYFSNFNKDLLYKIILASVVVSLSANITLRSSPEPIPFWKVDTTSSHILSKKLIDLKSYSHLSKSHLLSFKTSLLILSNIVNRFLYSLYGFIRFSGVTLDISISSLLIFINDINSLTIAFFNPSSVLFPKCLVVNNILSFNCLLVSFSYLSNPTKTAYSSNIFHICVLVNLYIKE